MESAYYDIYKELYKDYNEDWFFHPRRPPFREDYYLNAIKEAIEDADKEGNLRPDAKYFLIVNFHHLIVLPILVRRDTPEADFTIRRTGLTSDIREDIKTIISNTRRQEREEDISGHQIMRTIDRLWRDLKTTKLEVWG